MSLLIEDARLDWDSLSALRYFLGFTRMLRRNAVQTSPSKDVPGIVAQELMRWTLKKQREAEWKFETC